MDKGDNRDMVSAVTDMNSFTIIDDDMDNLTAPNSGQRLENEQQIEHLVNPHISAAFHKNMIRSSNLTTATVNSKEITTS